MSMIETFLNAKELLKDDLNEIREEMLKVASDKADARIDKFIDGVKTLVASASDKEFVEFITSGKLEDEDINAAILFRAEAKKGKEAKVCDEPCADPNECREDRVHPVHVFVLEV